MQVPVEVPSVGEAVVEMRVRKWHKSLGATVAKDEPLVEVTTDKVDFMIDAPVAGVLSEIRAANGAEIHPHDIVAMISALAR